MDNSLNVLYLTAASIGFFHTLLGPDHYLPFIAMSKARGWALSKTLLITLVCGLGHVGSSVILGLVGVGLGLAVTGLTSIESFRGNIAGWLLVAFGLIYAVWGVRRAIRNKPHTHWHHHRDGMSHGHVHVHAKEHLHPHELETRSLTPWLLFTIFVFGPCEPLIPILMYPAAKESLVGLLGVTTVFSVTTVGTMLGVVTISSLGINRLAFGSFERYSHALAGAAILLCGIGIQFLGL